jgi:hypothetical protein
MSEHSLQLAVGQPDRWIDGKTSRRQVGRQADIERDRKAEGQETDEWMDTQTDRQTDR